MIAPLAATLAGALLGAIPVAGPDAGAAVDEILTQDHYYFCAPDNEYHPSEDDQRWCELAATSQRDCPGFAQVCARELEHQQWELSGEPGGEAEGEPESGEREVNGGRGPQQGARSRAKRERRTIELPNLGGLAKVLMWLLLLGIAAGVIAAIARNLVRGEGDEGPELEPEPDASESLIAAQAEVMRVVETDVQRLLARAEDEARRGQHDAAIANVHAALLRRLEGEQLISVDRWKTNGDYIRALRSRAPLRDEVRELVREVEQVQFGSAVADEGRYRSIRARVLAIVGRAALALALGLGLGVGGLACDPEPVEPSPTLIGLGSGPSGQRAVGELLARFGIDARHRTQTITELTQTSGAIVLLDGAMLVEEDWARLIEWIEGGGMLVIATGIDIPPKLGISYVSGAQGPDGAVLTELVHERSSWYFENLELAAPPGRALESRTWTYELLARPVINRDSEPVALRDTRGEGQVVVFAESDLFTNAALLVADNGALLVNLFRESKIETVEFVDGYTGLGADNPFESVRNARLGALFIQMLVLLALLFLAVGIPFARLRDPPTRRRRAFAEHVRTLGQRYAQARAARYVASLYCAWALDRLRDRLRAGGAGGLHPLAVAIAARTGRSESAVMQILVEANDLREADVHLTRGGSADLQLMRALAELLSETGGVR